MLKTESYKLTYKVLYLKLKDKCYEVQKWNGSLKIVKSITK